LPELSVRAEFALLLRALHRAGYDDLMAGHVTVALGDGTMLVNPFELAWHEVRASDIVLMDMDGAKLEGRYNISPAVELHISLRRSRPDVVVAFHNHPRWSNNWAGMKRIPPIYDQTSAQVGAELVLVDEYDGQFTDVGNSEAAVHAFGDAQWGVLANHGVLVTASSIAEAFVRGYTLEWRSRRAYEIECAGGGVPLADDIVAAFARAFERGGTPKWWQTALRRELRADMDVLY
jgi:ribulose-5-phosphate 4-epimerase/fuculose-1-phosphate aldolase